MPGWLSGLSVRLQLRSQSRGSQFKPHVRLCTDSSDCGVRFGLCVSLFLCPSPAHTLSLSISKINKIFFKRERHNNEMQCKTLDWTWIREKHFTIKKIGQLVNYGPYFIHTHTHTHTHTGALERACKCRKILTINPGER